MEHFLGRLDKTLLRNRRNHATRKFKGTLQEALCLPLSAAITDQVYLWKLSQLSLIPEFPWQCLNLENTIMCV